MSGPCCDSWRATGHRWCPSCGERLDGRSRAFWRVHADAIIAVLIAYVGWGAVRVATVQVLRRMYNPSAALFAALAASESNGSTGGSGPSAVNESGPSEEGGYDLPPRCELTGESRVVGNRADVASLEMVARGETLGIGWVVPRARRGASDGSGAVSLRFAGDQIEFGEEATGVAPPLAPGPVLQLDRVTPLLWLDSTRNVSDDGVEVDGLNQVLRCGSLRSTLAAQVPGLGAVESRPGEAYDCRTLPVGEGVYFGARSGRLANGAASPTIELFARRDADQSPSPTLWTLPFAFARLPAREPLLVGLRHAYDLEGAHGVALSDGRIVVAFRFRNALYLGTVSSDLQRAEGALVRLPTLGGDVGLPRLATDGRDVFVVFADRHSTPHRVAGQPPPEPDRYSIWYSVFRAGEASHPWPLGTSFAEMEDEFAPSVASLPDGSWAVTWSAGPRHPRDWNGVTQRIYLRRYQHDGRYLGGPLQLSRGVTASDSRVIAKDDRIVVAWTTGAHSTRRVIAQGGRCR